MFEYFKNNPWKTITGIITIITTLSGAGYGAYNKSSVYFDTFASKTYVKEQVTALSLDVVGVAIMRYEDELMAIDFLVETNTAKPMDKVNKKNIERRLIDLKNKRDRLEGEHNESTK